MVMSRPMEKQLSRLVLLGFTPSPSPPPILNDD